MADDRATATGVTITTTNRGATSELLVGGYDQARAPSPPASVRSTASAVTRKRRAELEAAERLAALKEQQLQLQIQADLVQKRLALEMSIIEDEADQPRPPTPAEQRQKVDEWLRTNPLSAPRPENDVQPHEHLQPRSLRFEDPPRRDRSPTPTRTRGGIEQLATALEKMARPRVRHTELPAFSGSPNEWLPFQAAMRDSTRLYQIPPTENLLRLRTALKGAARDAVATLLYTASDPEAIMKTLEQCYGRPEVLVEQALADIKKLPRLGTSACELNTFAIKLQNITCVLKNIDRRGYLYNPMLTREVLDKLSPHIRSRWCDYAEEVDATSDPEIIVLSRFLIREADRALKYAYTPNASAAPPAKKEQRPAAIAPSKKKPSAIYTVVEASEELNHCPNCEQAHTLPQCPTFKTLTVGQRWDFVREKRLCFRCIKSKHRRVNCKSKPCGVNNCHRPHHPMLHEDPPAAPMPSSSTSEAVLSVAPTDAAGSRSILLKMCPVVIVGPRGEMNTYALLDEGATITLIDEDLAQSIGADGPPRPLNLQGVNMSQREGESKIVTVKLRGKHSDALHQLQARTIKNLKLHQQSIPETLLKHEHLRDLLQSEVCYERARPGILVGTDHWEHIVSRELRVGKPNEPAASKTQLGWVIHGTMPSSLIYDTGNVLHVYAPEQRAILDLDEQRDRDDRGLHELLEAHFRIDALGVALKPRVNSADQRATSIVERTIKKIDRGYEVGLPWRSDDPNMPPNYNQAFRRLRKIEQKMDADPNFAEGYTKQIENLLKKGYAAPCDGSEQASPVRWFLPHFAVQNPNKPGKTRLVFDAAAKSHGVSLNDHLLEGPDLLQSLQGILFRFRERRVAITADIQEMFLQIKIRAEDQPAQQFLWRGDDRSNPPRLYKMTSLIFGAASSPFIAHYVRNHNARQHAHTHPRALEAITQNHYMDDLVASYDEEEEARRSIEEIRTVHAAAGFTLRGWRANCKEVLRDVPADLQAAPTPVQLGGEELCNKILGLIWNNEQDELGFNTSMNRVAAEVRTHTRAPTKREALSAVMSIYDPLGLLSHYTIRAKIILQSLWRLKMPWDEPIPAEEEELFTWWLQQLAEIAQLRLNRCYALDHYERVELHVLCDASEQAYATVAYWRILNCDGSIRVSLVAAKAKVAPRRTQTIPRLELQAAVIGARLAETIKREHRIEISRTIYWTDSTTVVHWIYHDSRRYTPFVAHRLGEITELTHKDEWRWLPTEENVADDATRLCQTPINENDRWFRGPRFLFEPEDRWPIPRSPGEEDDVQEVLHTTEDSTARDDWLPDPARFSKYETLVRTTARVLAFTDICRHRATRMEHRHIERAEQVLMQRAQRESFGPELKKIEAGRPITKGSRLYKLDPVLEDGLLRVRGRIGAATAPIETKRPIILDGRHHLTKLLVLREHCGAGHANRERVTNDLRQRYWVIHLRPTVRAVERSCTLCRVRRARPQVPAAGDLPRARLDPFHRPFTNCGVDYFGPMIVKVGRRREKRWGALFTCLTTRAVHIEVVGSLTTDAAIMALRRMAARRGWPRLMYSDNATNFKGADQELRTAYAEWAPALHNEALLHRMEWRFIPPGAPNQGGAWERLVRSIKTALKATLQEREPAEEVLRTLLTEAEYSVNARPLTHVSVNPLDPEALTPNHFLLGSSGGLPTTGPCEEADRRTWRACQALADIYWRRWVREYLPTLVPRGEPNKNERPLESGDVVVIMDHTLPRNTWPLGIVEQTYPGPDGKIRVVNIRTKTGVFKRPVSRLVVLEKEATQAAPGGGL